MKTDPSLAKTYLGFAIAYSAFDLVNLVGNVGLGRIGIAEATLVVVWPTATWFAVRRLELRRATMIFIGMIALASLATIAHLVTRTHSTSYAVSLASASSYLQYMRATHLARGAAPAAGRAVR